MCQVCCLKNWAPSHLLRSLGCHEQFSFHEPGDFQVTVFLWRSHHFFALSFCLPLLSFLSDASYTS